MSLFLPLDDMIAGSDALYAELSSRLPSQLHFSNARSELASVSASLAIEHAQSILMLIAEGKPSSALALVRVQYEALVRAAWLYFGASDTAIAKFFAPIPADTVKEPDLFPTVTEMLRSIEGKAPGPLHRALSDFKTGAWGAMNSFTHGLLRPMAGQRNGYHPGLLSTAIQNSNGAAMFGLLLLAQATNNLELSLVVIGLSRTYAAVLPPLKFKSLSESLPAQR